MKTYGGSGYAPVLRSDAVATLSGMMNNGHNCGGKTSK